MAPQDDIFTNKQIFFLTFFLAKYKLSFLVFKFDRDFAFHTRLFLHG